MDVYSVHVLSDASTGLDEIYHNRLSNYGVVVAEKLLSRIRRSIYNLDVFPGRYPTYKVYKSKCNLRLVNVAGILVLYEVDDRRKAVYVRYIVDGRRDVRNVLE